MLGAALALMMGLATASGVAAADTRTLDLYNTHTKERLTITFKKNGKYVGSALKELNRFLRDWRRNEPTNMDPRLFDTVWEVYSRSGSRQPVHVVSGYRSLKTNNMLRSRSRAVAKHSQHTLGKAMDFFLPDVKTAKLREIGVAMQRGGVGFYPTANTPFVHIDVGSVRAWPRMSRQQLVKLFPDGKTVHIPADGKPLAGYQQALAELKRNGTVTRPLAIADDETSTKKGKGLLAMLFGDEEDESEELNSASRTTGQSLTAGDDEAPAPKQVAEPPPPPVVEPAPPPPPVVVVEAPTPPATPERPVEPTVTSLAEATLPADAAALPPVQAPAPAEAEVAAAPPPPPPRVKPKEIVEAVEVAAIGPDIRPRPRPEFAIAEEAPVQIALADRAPADQAPVLSAPVPAAVAAAASPASPPLQPDEPIDARQALAAVVDDSPEPESPTDAALGYASATEVAPVTVANPPLRTASLTAGPSTTRPRTASPTPARIPDEVVAGKTDPLAILSRPEKATTLPIYDGGQSAWTGVYAKLEHPHQTSGDMVFTSPTVVIQAQFDRRPYGEMSSQGFSGQSLTRLPVLRFRGERDFAAAR
jgi:uncharacterized protein YcbK (DUF882 family)